MVGAIWVVSTGFVTAVPPAAPGQASKIGTLRSSTWPTQYAGKPRRKTSIRSHPQPAPNRDSGRTPSRGLEEGHRIHQRLPAQNPQLRRQHEIATVIPRRQRPAIRFTDKRVITLAEHQKIIAA